MSQALRGNWFRTRIIDDIPSLAVPCLSRAQRSTAPHSKRARFIATTAGVDPLEVLVLIPFRDDVLLRSSVSRGSRRRDRTAFVI
jgi:hypothetical protein